MISFSCSSCSREYKVDDDKAGMRTKCKVCDSALTVPMPEEPTWEILPDEPAKVGCEPACPRCGSASFSFKTIFGPVSLAEKREQLLAVATAALERSLADIRAEAARRNAAVDQRADDEMKPADAQWRPVEYLTEQVRRQKDIVRAWAEEQERAAHQAFEEQRRRVRAEHPVRSKNRLYLVYCDGCGHVVTATPAAGNIEEGLTDLCRAVEGLHKTITLYVRAMAEEADEVKWQARLQTGLLALNNLLNG
jgi:hypothetical protein